MPAEADSHTLAMDAPKPDSKLDVGAGAAASDKLRDDSSSVVPPNGAIDTDNDDPVEQTTDAEGEDPEDDDDEEQDDVRNAEVEDEIEEDYDGDVVADVADGEEDDDDAEPVATGRLKLKIALQVDSVDEDDTLYCSVPLALPRMAECLEVKTAICVAADNPGVAGEMHSWGEVCLRKPVGLESGPRHRVFVHEGETVEEGLYQEHHMTFGGDHPLCQHVLEGTLLQFWIRIGGADNSVSVSRLQLSVKYTVAPGPAAPNPMEPLPVVMPTEATRGANEADADAEENADDDAEYVEEVAEIAATRGGAKPSSKGSRAKREEQNGKTTRATKGGSRGIFRRYRKFPDSEEVEEKFLQMLESRKQQKPAEPEPESESKGGVEAAEALLQESAPTNDVRATNEATKAGKPPARTTTNVKDHQSAEGNWRKSQVLKNLKGQQEPSDHAPLKPPKVKKLPKPDLSKTDKDKDKDKKQSTADREQPLNGGVHPRTATFSGPLAWQYSGPLAGYTGSAYSGPQAYSGPLAGYSGPIYPTYGQSGPIATGAVAAAGYSGPIGYSGPLPQWSQPIGADQQQAWHAWQQHQQHQQSNAWTQYYNAMAAMPTMTRQQQSGYWHTPQHTTPSLAQAQYAQYSGPVGANPYGSFAGPQVPSSPQTWTQGTYNARAEMSGPQTGYGLDMMTGYGGRGSYTQQFEPLQSGLSGYNR